MKLAYWQSPIGLIEIGVSDVGVCRLVFQDCSPPSDNVLSTAHDAQCITQVEAVQHTILRNCLEQLGAYFTGQLTVFDLPLDLSAGTPFQQAVWQRLQSIQFSELMTYQDIAIQLDNPKAVRAVGAANGKNPVSIIVPCHRVIGSNGTLTGYAGGLSRKQWLLRHEDAQLSCLL